MRALARSHPALLSRVREDFETFEERLVEGHRVDRRQMMRDSRRLLGLDAFFQGMADIAAQLADEDDSFVEAAERLRLQDSDVVLMFVTNMAQYAINGYAVGALDFVLKPVNYYTFSVRFARAITRAEHRENGQILLTLPDCVRRIDTRQIYYVEVQNRMLHYHTELGEFVLRGTMQSAEKELSRYHFVRCNHWYLVNLSHVAEVRREMVVVAGAELEISRRNRTAFLTALTDYVGGNGCWPVCPPCRRSGTWPASGSPPFSF